LIRSFIRVNRRPSPVCLLSKWQSSSVWNDRSTSDPDDEHHQMRRRDNNTVMLYQSKKPQMIQFMEQFYVRHRLYTWLVLANSIVLLNPLYAFNQMTIGLCVGFSGFITIRSIFHEPKVQKPILIQSIQLLVPGDYSRLLLTRSIDVSDLLHSSSSSHEDDHSSREVVVYTSDLICDHDSVFATSCMPFESQWKQLLLNTSDMTARNEFRFAVMPTLRSPVLSSTSGAASPLSLWQKKQGHGSDYSYNGSALSMSLPYDESSPVVYVVRANSEKVEKLRSLLDYYRSLH